jgi:hypothetical protein
MSSWLMVPTLPWRPANRQDNGNSSAIGKMPATCRQGKLGNGPGDD